MISLCFLISCNQYGSKRFQLPKNVPRHFISDYTESMFVNSIVDKLMLIDWYIDKNLSTKKRAIYYLNEAISIYDNKLCDSNQYSNISINDLANDYKMINQIEIVLQKSGVVYFYNFKNHDNNETLLEIREFEKNQFSILCGIKID
jgi:uncharacterized Rmd1/YagE family protein